MKTHGIVDDPIKIYPWARCVLLLVWGYAPFSRDEIIPAYYLASNASYHGAKALQKRLAERGMKAEFVELPARAAALAAGIGTKGKNGLLRLQGLGSRFVLQTIVTDACEPAAYNEPALDCGDCDRCASACPMGAIDPELGLDVKRCMRYYMDGPMHLDNIKEKLVQYMGCELCQHACPYNEYQTIAEPPEYVKAAFDPKRLLAGDAAEARRLVGRNMTGGGKLTAEAIVFAARSGNHEDLLKQARDCPEQFEAVADALRWAGERNEKK